MSTQSHAAHQPLMGATPQRWLLITLLTMMSMVGLVGSDVYLPSLPVIGEALHQNSESMQYTLSFYLLGLAIGQLCLGPLSDRMGRKTLVLIGMLIYALASVSCAMSASYMHMMISRLIQALGASSGLVIGRAIVVDVFDKKEAGKVFATIFPVVGMSPAISPAIGGFIAYYWGWQSCFIFIALFALSIFLLAWTYLRETLPVHKRQSLALKQALLAYPRLLSNRKFLTYALAPCLAYLAYFAYIAQSPFIFDERGYGEREIGVLYITLSITYVSGNIWARKLLDSMVLSRVLYWGYTLFIAGGILLLVAALLDLPILLIIMAMSILTFGNGFLIPMGFAGALSTAPSQAGYASGLLGFLQLSCAAFSTAMIGALTDNSVLYLAVSIFAMTLIGFISFALFMRSPTHAEAG